MISHLIKIILFSLFLISPFFAHYIHAEPLESNRLFAELSLRPSDISQTKVSDFYNKWKGVKYKWGGSSKAGIDCSALTQVAFKKLHINLPRTTTQQIKQGTVVEKEELKVGDLVFFKTTPQQRHVGIYVGKGKFMHASTSKGVTISELDNQYWLAHYELSKRVTS